MPSSHEDIIKKFANRQRNKRTGRVEWNGSNVYCVGDTLYSYGSHFPLARLLGYMGDRWDLSPFFLKNGDKYSNSTSHHQSMTDEHCPGPVVSRNHLLAVGLPFDKVTLENVMFFQQGSRHWVYKDTKTDKYYEEAHTRRESGWGEPRPNPTDQWFTGAFEDQLVEKEWTPPDNGMFVPTYKRKGRENRIISGTWFIPSGVVLRNGRVYMLCSKDENGALYLQVIRKPESIQHAFALAGEINARNKRG